ncbi:MAG: DUF1801 domain-containing protein [bacterium]|nr:DUF1801 domain-containing protein [bacterium]
MNEIKAYINGFPLEVQEILYKIRTIILDAAPKADEAMAYGMPGYKTNKKPLVYFAAYDKHVGFYATPNGHEKFEKELSIYKQGKGSVQFQLNEQIPYTLIKKIVAFRIKNNELKYGKK